MPLMRSKLQFASHSIWTTREGKELAANRSSTDTGEKSEGYEHKHRVPECRESYDVMDGSAPGRDLMCVRLGSQNIVLPLADLSGTTCSTSQCSTILPLSSRRNMSMPAQLLSASPGHSW